MNIGNMMNMQQREPDDPLPDFGETVYISSLSLLKMLKHGREGVPNEVMGLMLGEFVDDYTVKVDDVFSMPQIGTGQSVEAVDEVFQVEMKEMLSRTGRDQIVVGWYHSHPGFGPWLSGIDQQTHKNAFETINKRCVAVVIDPIQSVKGKVVIDAFRLIEQSPIMAQETRQTSSNLGHIERPSAISLVHGCTHFYYNLSISYRRNLLEEQMLINLRKIEWAAGFKLKGFGALLKENEDTLKKEKELADLFVVRINEENAAAKVDTNRGREFEVHSTETKEEKLEKLSISKVGKIDPKKRLEEVVQKSIETNLSQILGISLSTVAF